MQIDQKILCVDDEPNNLQVLRQILKDRYHLIFATSGEKAIEACIKHRPDMVLLDIMMPGMDGIEVCRSLKEDPETSDIRVVAMTGYYTPEVEKKVLAAGAQVLLKKPFSSEEVLRECGFQEISEATIKG